MATILILSGDAHIFTPMHGGSERTIQLINSLKEQHTINVLTFGWAGSSFKTLVSPSVTHIHIVAEVEVARREARFRKGLIDKSYDLSVSKFASQLRTYQKKVSTFIETSDLLILETHAMSPFIQNLENIKIPVIYSSQNCEIQLAEQRYPKDSIDFEITKDMESAAINASVAMSYCSQEDIEHFKESYDVKIPTHYIPNGTEIIFDATPGSSYKSKDIFFIGSGHPPNITAIENIIKLAKVSTEYNFKIAGNAGHKFKNLDLPSNVEILGKVSDEKRDLLFRESFAFINPMEIGGGTHLKMMRALSYGIPIISSTVGARGFTDKEIQDCMVIGNNTDELANAINKLSNEKTYKKIASNGFKAAESYDWEIIKDSFSKMINDTLSNYNNKVINVNDFKSRNKENILVYSIIRNEAGFINQFYSQLKNMVESFPEYNFYLSLYENDSTDGTKERLLSKSWAFFKGLSIISENIMTKDYGSVKDEDRVKNLSIARNKAVEAGGFLSNMDYVMMVESDMTFDMNSIKKLLNFKDKEPDFDIVSTISIRNKRLYDAWATRRTPRYVYGADELGPDYKKKDYDKYYSTSNGVCLYRAKPFKEGARYGYINKVTKEFDCDTVIICQDFYDRGYKNIYILHNAPVFHEHR